MKTIAVEDCLSLGDALREIDRQVWTQFKLMVYNTLYAQCKLIKFQSNLSILLGEPINQDLTSFKLQSFLKNDFVLVSGDVVSNMKLEQVIKEHK